MDRRTVLASVGGLAVGLAGCLGRGADGDHDVGMTDMRFTPASYRVEPGRTVTWKNTSARAHTVTAYEPLPAGAAYFASGGYDSTAAAREAWDERGGGAIYAGETYTHTFEVPGRYPYLCIPHEREGMVGEIVVGEGSAGSPTARE